MTGISVTFGQLSGNTNNTEDEKKSARGKDTLSVLTTQKMIHKFLTCDRIGRGNVRLPKYTREELAKKLGITSIELDKLGGEVFYNKMINKINMPLVQLYCSTKWVDNGKKD